MFSYKQNEIHYCEKLKIIPKGISIYAQINLIISNDTKNLGDSGGASFCVKRMEESNWPLPSN